jgi:hypothetical protein
MFDHRAISFRIGGEIVISDSSRHGDDLSPELRTLLAECEEIVRTAPDASFAEIGKAFGPLGEMARGRSDEDLAMALEEGGLALAAVNHGALHDDASGYGTGEFDRLVWVSGFERDSETAEIRSFVIVDPSTMDLESISSDRFLESWLNSGGFHIVVRE